MSSPSGRLQVRRQNNRNALILLWKALTCVGFVVLTVSCAVTLTARLFPSHHWALQVPVVPDPALRQRLLEESYPGAFVDLWPDDTHTRDYRKTLSDCFPGYEQDDTQDCQVTLQQDDNQQTPVQRVALVRPPGLLGDVFVEFVHKVINLQAEQSYPIHLVPTTRTIIEATHNYSMIIRMATLPPLLEAADTALMLNNPTNNNLSVNELLDLVRSTIRFHCHSTQRTKDTALLTITLDRMIGFPSSTTKKLQKFLGIMPNPETKKNRVDMKELPLVVMDRVTAASELVESVAPAAELLPVVTQLVAEEVQASQNENGFCRPITSSVGESDGAKVYERPQR